MNIDIKQIIEQGGMTKSERLELVLKNLQSFYLDELEKSKKKLETIIEVIKINPDMMKGDNGKQ
jgi:hypothetical protein